MLTRVKIKNFKSISNEELELLPLTILTGTNSSGKSSVIQSIMLNIMHSSDGNFYSMGGLLRYVDEFKLIRNKRNNAKEVNIDIFFDDSIDDNDSKIGKFSFKENDVRKYDGFSRYFYDQPKYIEKPELLYLNANRIGAQDIVPSSGRRVGEQGENIFSTYEKIKNELVFESLAKFVESNTISYQMSQWLSYITGVESELKTERFGDQVKVYFSIKDLEGDVSPYNLGAGMSYISKVIIICLMAKKGDLVILENPEVQLHPKAQSHLGEFLSFIANNGVQLIVETHCEHLLNRVAYEVFEGHIPNEKVVIHYKKDVLSDFETLMMNEGGNYTDSNGNITIFPSGFFDATLDEILSMR